MTQTCARVTYSPEISRIFTLQLTNSSRQNHSKIIQTTTPNEPATQHFPAFSRLAELPSLSSNCVDKNHTEKKILNMAIENLFYQTAVKFK